MKKNKYFQIKYELPTIILMQLLNYTTMQNNSLIQQLNREDLSKIYTRAAEYPSISTKLISDMLNNKFYGDLSYSHVRDLESILGKKIINIFPMN